MENIPNRKLKKFKRPIKKPFGVGENLAVPSKEVLDNPFNRANNNANEDLNMDADMEEDSLPTMQQGYSLQNRLNPAFLAEDEVEETPPALKDYFIVGEMYTKAAIIAVACACFILGIFIAKIFLTPPSTIQNGLQGVIVNPEVPKGRARCGMAEKTQGCVLYIMNPQRQDLNGRDFYDLAAQLTGRQRFIVETGNMRYASTKIHPGEIAQLNIPPLQ